MVKIPLIVDTKSCLQLEVRAQKQNKKIAPKEESLRKLFYAKLCVILARIFEVLFWLVPNPILAPVNNESTYKIQITALE